MNMAHPSPRRRPTNVSLDEACVADAKALGINISQACERGLAEAVKAAREAQWLSENREALDCFNAYVEQHGLPLEDHRLF